MPITAEWGVAEFGAVVAEPDVSVTFPGEANKANEIAAVAKSLEKEEDASDEEDGGGLAVSVSTSKLSSLKPILFNADYSESIISCSGGALNYNTNRPQSTERSTRTLLQHALKTILIKTHSRENLKIEADKLVPSIAKAVMNQRAELRACEVRYAERFAAKGNEGPKAAFANQRTL